MGTLILEVIQPILLFGSDQKGLVSTELLQALLKLHSIIRYLILIAIIAAIYLAYMGKRANTHYGGNTRKAGLFTMIFADLQLLIGIFIYGLYLQRHTNFKMGQLKDAIDNSAIRFFIMEHAIMMFIALVCIHVGYFKAKNAATAIAANKNQFGWYLAALIVILVAIPWPFLPAYGRPWI